MALPFANNTTCDIYRSGNGPPGVPDVAGVKCFVTANYQRGLSTGESEPTFQFSHWMQTDLATDIRDDYAYGAHNGNPDTVWIPTKNDVAFVVVFVERKRGGTDYKKVYLSRKSVGGYPAKIQ